MGNLSFIKELQQWERESRNSNVWKIHEDPISVYALYARLGLNEMYVWFLLAYLPYLF